MARSTIAKKKPSPAKTAPKTASVAAATPRNAVSHPIDTDLVREIAALLNGTDLTEIEVEKGDLRIRVARGAMISHQSAPSPVSVSVAAPAATVVTQAAAEPDHAGVLKSPMVGTAYRRPNPESKAFVEVGSVVKAGDRVLLVEAMKTFNEIVAPRGGTISAIFVEDGQPVEFGQALLVID